MDYSYLHFNPARPSQRTNFLLTDFATEYTDLERKSLGNQIMTLDQKPRAPNIKESEFDKKQPHTINFKLGYYLHLNNPKEWAFIILFSIIASLFLVFLDKLIFVGFQKRKIWSDTKYPVLNYFIWVITAVIFILGGTSVGYFISPDADGSGIPEMKTVLSGVPIYRYFSFNAFIGKSLGLFAVLVSGASVGKVGPYVHLSCLICTRLMKSNYFEKIDKSTSLKSTMLSVACATGITFALGCPLGGVLFSIESTASIYMVSNLWKSFFSSVICCFIFKIFYGETVIKVVDLTTAINVNMLFKLINFIIIGLISGIVGASCATLVSKGVYIRKKSSVSWLNNRFKFAIITGIITASTTFFIPGLKNFDKPIMSYLFSANDDSIQDDWAHPGEGCHLLFSCICKYIITVLGLSCTMPSGVFGPMFSVGALLGRFYGHLIYCIFGINMESAFAMAASAGAFSGFSHTISSALMVFELAGQTKYLPFLLLTCLIANLIGQGLSMGIFDVLLAIKNLPYLPAIKSNDAYSMSAGDLMDKIDHIMHEGEAKMVDGLSILSHIPKKYVVLIPILDEKGVITKTISPQDLFSYLNYKYNAIKKNYTYKIQNYFNELFRYSKKKIFNQKNLFSHIKYKFKKLYLKLKDKERLILNKNFYHESSLRIISFFEKNKEKDNIYLSKTIDFNDKMINCGKSALTIDKGYPLLKIQFLFTFLNLSHIFVTDCGKLVGVITKEAFINKTRS